MWHLKKKTRKIAIIEKKRKKTAESFLKISTVYSTKLNIKSENKF